MTAVYKKEMSVYFKTMLAYVFLAIFTLVVGLFFVINNVLAGSSSFAVVLGNVNYVMVLLAPILTMRSFAEEKKTKSDQLLLTAPVTTVGIVMGKYLAALSVLIIALLTTLIQVVILNIYGSPYAGEIILGYLGFILMGSSFIALGLFISGLASNQLTAAVGTMGVLLILWMLDSLIGQVQNPIIGGLINFLSIFSYFNDFARGILSFSSVVYLASFTALFLFLAWITLKRRTMIKG